jgi:hypothetical protein
MPDKPGAQFHDHPNMVADVASDGALMLARDLPPRS